jgi:hypothetical protein
MIMKRTLALAAVAVMLVAICGATLPPMPTKRAVRLKSPKASSESVNVPMATVASVTPTLKVVKVVASKVSTVTLAWDGVVGATGFTLYWGSQTGNYTNFVSIGTAQSLVIANLNVGATYFFAVTAHDVSTESAKSNEVVYNVPAGVLYGISVQFLSSSSSGGGFTNVFTFPEVIVTNTEAVKYFATKLSIYPK